MTSPPRCYGNHAATSPALCVFNVPPSPGQRQAVGAAPATARGLAGRGGEGRGLAAGGPAHCPRRAGPGLRGEPRGGPGAGGWGWGSAPPGPPPGQGGSAPRRPRVPPGSAPQHTPPWGWGGLTLALPGLGPRAEQRARHRRLPATPVCEAQSAGSPWALRGVTGRSLRGSAEGSAAVPASLGSCLLGRKQPRRPRAAGSGRAAPAPRVSLSPRGRSVPWDGISGTRPARPRRRGDKRHPAGRRGRHEDFVPGSSPAVNALPGGTAARGWGPRSGARRRAPRSQHAWRGAAVVLGRFYPAWSGLKHRAGRGEQVGGRNSWLAARGCATTRCRDVSAGSVCALGQPRHTPGCCDR